MDFEAAVCLMQIPDPAAPATRFQFTPGERRPSPWPGPFVTGPFDENALELALQLRQQAGAKLHALSAGGKLATAALRKALAVQADDATRIDVDSEALDTAGLASLLARAIRETPGVKLVFAGRQSGDWDAGQLGPLLAEELGFACATLTKRVENATAESVTVVRERDGRLERVQVNLPAVLTVTNDAGNQLRVAKVRDILLADRKPIAVRTPAELGLLDMPEPLLETIALRRPPATGRTLQMIAGASAAERGVALARQLMDLAGLN